MSVNWHELMKLVAPVVGEVASGGERGSFMEGFQRAQQRAEQKRAHDDEAEQRRKLAGAQFLLTTGQHAQGIEDPIDFENYVNLVEHAGTAGNYIKPGEARSAMPYNASRRNESLLKQLNGEIKKLKDNNHDVYTLAEQSGVRIDLGNGKSIPLARALEMTESLKDGEGKPIKPPKKADAAASTDFGRFLARWAKDQGKTVEQLTAQDEVAAKKAYGQADDKGPDATLQAIRELQLETLKNKPPKEDPLAQVSEVDPLTGEIVTSLVPRKPGEVSRRPAPEPTQAQYQSGEYAGRMEQAEGTIGKLQGDIAGMNIVSFEAQQKMRATFQSATMQSYMQAARNFINAKLRRESGAAISPTEFSEARQQYLPQPGDSDAVLLQKQANRQLVFENNKKSAGRAYAPPPKLPTPGAAPKEGDTQPIAAAGYPAGAEQTFTGGKWIRTK